MTFWFWFGDKVLTNIRGEFVSCINLKTLSLYFQSPYGDSDWTMAEYDTLTTNKEK